MELKILPDAAILEQTHLTSNESERVADFVAMDNACGVMDAEGRTGKDREDASRIKNTILVAGGKVAEAQLKQTVRDILKAMKEDTGNFQLSLTLGFIEALQQQGEE